MKSRFVPISREAEKDYLKDRLEMRSHYTEKSKEYRGICPYCGNNQGKFRFDSEERFHCDSCGVDKHIDEVFSRVAVTDLCRKLL